MAARTFEDSRGEVWEVFEVHRASAKPGAVSAGLEHGWLAFVNGGEKRRLAPFPTDWERADVSELERLCAQARAAVPRRSDGRRSFPHVAEVTDAIEPSRDHTAPPPESVRTSGNHPTIISRGAGELASPTGELADVEAAVRGFAHEARVTGVPAIEAMVRLKAMLLQRFPGTTHAARDMRRVRRWFVEAYYFERNA